MIGGNTGVIIRIALASVSSLFVWYQLDKIALTADRAYEQIILQLSFY